MLHVKGSEELVLASSSPRRKELLGQSEEALMDLQRRIQEEPRKQ